MKYWMHTYWMYVLCTQLIYLLIVIVLWLFYYSTGTRQFIRSNTKFLNDCTEQVPTTCNKDTGGCKTLHSWSRGVFFVVSAGGHIEYWQPLYRLNCVLEIYCEFKLGAHLLLLENYLDLVFYTSPLILKSH